MPLSSLAPAVLLAAAAIALLRPGRRPRPIPLIAEGAALAALALCLAGAARFAFLGVGQGVGYDGPLVRLDVVTALVAPTVAFIGWVVVRYSRTYMDGAAREGWFHALMLTVLGLVLLQVQAGSLALLVPALAAIGLVLRQLLLFFPDRAPARRAAAKFTLVWGAGDAALILATGLLWLAYGTMDIATIEAAARMAPLPPAAEGAAGLLVLAALLKTAAFPLHGWLTEVMEAPTPVSALLHAGIINSGGLLLIRLAWLVQASPGAMAALVMLGGFTALFGALVMLTQSAVKTALAWSTVAQMGFMLLQCGLGLWPVAMLHILAHSLYKAHAFLSSGGAIRAVQATRRPGPVAAPGVGAVIRAFGLALALYGLAAVGFTLLAGPKSPQALALGLILVSGVAYLVAQGLADAAPRALTQRTLAASTAVTLSYFGLQALAVHAAGGTLPAPPVAGALEWALIGLTVTSFCGVAVAQALFPHWAHHPAAAGLRVHIANGFYLNAALDRLIGGFRAVRS
ncbi:proton-conducting transporter membrane subunit [Nitrospirillum viridazoti]|uniref:Probable inorganic carbon transporter subunit DabB n=1 Tax=Nitrospirillum viridazoti CBAmc TaxID=1441467 RepID=A0A248K2G7_9PROT|nr:proton-conducting transporter membrane subunit [Nitrospirillum amazonense]ASG25040.1 oxidoreductase [Nitrospirillum amazonense CBAmc]TWB31206.1 NAD(P)H-quinone oxidoreductase subunit 5 [Nitrospirillum amazonense]